MIDQELLSTYVDEIVKLKERYREDLAALMKCCREDTGLSNKEINEEVKAAEEAWRNAE